MRVSKKYMVHDESGSGGIGDLVTIVESRPLSRNKRWRLRSIDRKAVG
jgi:small subunit ribosomal protein S17